MRIAYPVLLSALLLPSLAMAQSSDTTGTMAVTHGSTSSLSVQDTSFIKKAAQAGLAEVQQGQLAQSNGAPAVQSLGATMVADHSKANSQLKALAAQLGDTVPAMATPKDAAMTMKLQSLHGTTFDTKYLAGQKLAHEQAIALFKSEIAVGSNDQLKAFAKQTLPVLQGHLKMIEQTAG